MPAQNLSGFSEKVALVTNCDNAVGRAVALQLALQGCYVIAGYSNQDEKAKRALLELQSLGTLAHAVETNCAAVEDARNLVGEVEKLFGRLDLLVNSAKLEPPQTAFLEMTEADWTRSVDENLKAVFFVTQAAVNLMRSRPKPVIVNVASGLDTDETARNIAFAGVQAGIVGMTRALAAELAPKFRVNCVQVSEKKITTQTLDPVLFPPQAGVASDDVARTVVYLLSPEAVGLTGQVLTVGK